MKLGEILASFPLEPTGNFFDDFLDILTEEADATECSNPEAHPSVNAQFKRDFRRSVHSSSGMRAPGAAVAEKIYGLRVPAN